MDEVFFGIQLAVHSPAGDPWRDRVAKVLRGARQDQDVVLKRQFHAELVNLVAAVEDQFIFGFWDFISGTEAGAEFDEWVSGVEDDATTGDAFGDGDHVLVTFLFLMPSKSNSADAIGERCDIPEEEWGLRATYSHLLQSIKLLSFSSVRSDAAYLAPGDGTKGLTADHLRGEGYSYLVPLEAS